MQKFWRGHKSVISVCTAARSTEYLHILQYYLVRQPYVGCVNVKATVYSTTLSKRWQILWIITDYPVINTGARKKILQIFDTGLCSHFITTAVVEELQRYISWKELTESQEEAELYLPHKQTLHLSYPTSLPLPPPPPASPQSHPRTSLLCIQTEQLHLSLSNCGSKDDYILFFVQTLL